MSYNVKVQYISMCLALELLKLASASCLSVCASIVSHANV